MGDTVTPNKGSVRAQRASFDASTVPMMPRAHVDGMVSNVRQSPRAETHPDVVLRNALKNATQPDATLPDATLPDAALPDATLRDVTLRDVTPSRTIVDEATHRDGPEASMLDADTDTASLFDEARTLIDESTLPRESWGCPLCGAVYSPELERCPVDGEKLLVLSWIHTEADSLIGVVIQGRYELESVLGRGGMGTVYQARHRALGKRFALKVLRPEVAVDADSVKRFVQEAQIAATVKHDNLADVSDCGEITGDDFPALGSARLPFFVMEMLRGQSLGDRLRDKRTIDAVLASEVLRQCALGLSAAHEAGVIHRDLKPDNIFLSEVEGKVVCKILDFGVAKIISRAKLTKAGTVFGTPYYMSPEQASGGALDGRTDLYALGVVLYEAMSGRVPFSAETHMGVLTKHVFEVPEPIETAVADPTTLGPLGAIIMCCLEKDPAARYKSANDLALAVEHAMSAGFALPAARPQPALRLRAASPVVLAAAPRATKPSGLPKWLWIAVPAGILLGIGFAVISRTFFHRGSAETATSAASSAPESTAARAVSVPVVAAATSVSSIAAASIAASSTSAPTASAASAASSAAASVATSNAVPPPVTSPTLRQPHPAASASSVARPSGVIETW